MHVWIRFRTLTRPSHSFPARLTAVLFHHHFLSSESGQARPLNLFGLFQGQQKDVSKLREEMSSARKEKSHLNGAVTEMKMALKASLAHIQVVINPLSAIVLI